MEGHKLTRLEKGSTLGTFLGVMEIKGEVAGNEMFSHRNQPMQGPPSSVLGFSARNRGKE